MPAPDRRPRACSRRGERPHLLIPRLARLGCRLCFVVEGPHGMVGDLPCGPIGVDLPLLASLSWPARAARARAVVLVRMARWQRRRPLLSLSLSLSFPWRLEGGAFMVPILGDLWEGVVICWAECATPPLPLSPLLPSIGLDCMATK
mmetsp:Transcript_4083/g.6082  ORF Transcript_4083/g.6082 Transcript_4083/m.6082 type:complete len:147 (-) Transcript_4083:41-481(-)